MCTESQEQSCRYATRLLSLRNEAAFAESDLSNLRTGHLRVGATESVSIYLVPQLAQEFLKRFPSVQIELRRDSSAYLLTELKDRRINLTLVFMVPNDAELECALIMRDDLVLIGNPKASDSLAS
jgi:DNA-binding transcriptional LysR family regulator